MKLVKIIIPFLASAHALMVVSCTPTTSKNQDFLSSYGNLKQASQLSDAKIYRGDMKKAKRYDSVYIEEVRVQAPENQVKKKISDTDLANLRKMLISSLEKGLTESSYKLTSTKGPKTLALRAAITDIHPGNPKLFATGYIPYVGTATTALGATTGSKFGAGSAIVEAEVIDSMSKEQFFAIIDKNVGSKLEVTAGLTRWGHIEKSFEEWAKRISKELVDLNN